MKRPGNPGAHPCPGRRAAMTRICQHPGRAGEQPFLDSSKISG